MTGVVLRFERSGQQAGWTNQELAELQRIGQLLANAGLPVASEQGVTDEGDPWFIFIRSDNEEVVAHIARIDGVYTAVGAGDDTPVWGSSFRSIADTLVARQPLAVPRGKGHGVFTHPIAVLAAFVAMALVYAENAQADTNNGVAEGGESGPDAPAWGFLAQRDGAHSPHSKPTAPITDGNTVNVAMAAVASALALAFEADPVLAAGEDGDVGSGTSWWAEVDGPERLSAPRIDFDVSSDSPDVIWRGGDSAPRNAGSEDLFRFLRQSESQNTRDAALLWAPSHGDDETVADTPAPDEQITYAKSNHAGALPNSGSPPIFDLSPYSARVSEFRESDMLRISEVGQAVATGPVNAAGSSVQPATNGADDASAFEDAQGEYLNLTALVERFSKPAVDTSPAPELRQKASESAPERADRADEQDRQTEIDEDAGLPGAPFDDSDGDGMVTLTDAADVVIYDGGRLAVEGFELGRDRLMIAEDSGLQPVAVEETRQGDMQLVFDGDNDVVTFVGISLEDFASL